MQVLSRAVDSYVLPYTAGDLHDHPSPRVMIMMARQIRRGGLCGSIFPSSESVPPSAESASDSDSCSTYYYEHGPPGSFAGRAPLCHGHGPSTAAARLRVITGSPTRPGSRSESESRSPSPSPEPASEPLRLRPAKTDSDPLGLGGSRYCQ